MSKFSFFTAELRAFDRPAEVLSRLTTRYFYTMSTAIVPGKISSEKSCLNFRFIFELVEVLPRPTTGSLVSLILAWSLMGILTLVGGGLGMGMTVGGSSPASHFPSLTTVCLRLMCFTPRTQIFIHRTGELWCFSIW
jgi:hypothetical protein